MNDPQASRFSFGASSEDMQPETAPSKSALPQEVLEQKQAITLFQVAVGALALIAILGVIGVFLLAWSGKESPDGIWTVIGLCVGGLVALVNGSEARQG